MNDEQLIELFFARSETAIGLLGDRYGKLLRRVASNILKDERDAEECVQDSLLAVWNSIPPNRPKSLMAYVAGIARNVSTKRYHQNTAEKRNSYYDKALDELEECVPSVGDTESEVMQRELTRLLNSFLDGEKKLDRIIFVKRFWFSDGVKEIADALGMSENSVSVRLTRMRARLRQYLERNGFSI